MKYLKFGEAVRPILIATGIALQSAPAVAETSDSEAALIGAVISQALGGKTTLSDKAGEMEGWMVSARLLESAAAEINKSIGSHSGLILVGEETPNLGLRTTIMSQANKFNQEFSSLCKASPRSWSKGFVSENVVTALAGAISGAEKSETAISGYALKHGDRALVDALTGGLKGDWSRLEDMSVLAANSNLMQKWDTLRSNRYRTATACSKSEAGKALIARFDAMDSKITDSGDKGEASLLEQAARMEVALPEGSHVLRVHIEQAGGSITNTNNIFTRLGLPAVRVTGAIVIGYRIINPATGKTPSNKAGLIVCYSPRKTLGSIHRGNLPTIDEKQCLSRSADGSAK